MIKVEQEPFPEPPYERCCFCRKPTTMWYKPKDVAVCILCAAKAEPEDVPDKMTWCRRERIATHTMGDF